MEKLAFRIYGSPQNNDALVDFDEKGVMYRTGTSGYYSIDAEKPKIAVCLLDRKIDDRLKEKNGYILRMVVYCPAITVCFLMC